ncbi:MAG: MFS transporter [Sneathiella sp.]
MSSLKLTLLLCLAEILFMTAFATFPALTPYYFENWGLSGTEVGWINGAFFLGFTLVGVVSSTLTDRIDARRVVMVGGGAAFIGAFGFAFLSVDFWSALPWRFVSGAALACTYMPGLKLLTDRIEGGEQSRFIALYTACFSAGSAFSFLLIGQASRWFGVEAAVYSAVFGPPIALLILLLWTNPKANQIPRSWRQLLNFRVVLRNRKTMGYVIAYFCHTWELMAMRTFLVAFLAFAHTRTDAPAWMDISVIAAIIIFLGLPSSILGNELSLKIGRQRAITLIMGFALVTAAGLGFSADLPFVVVVLIAALYGFLVTADSSSITSGALTSAPAEFRGVTMAVHSLIGFSGAFAGPVVAGMVLDLGGGHETLMAWGVMYLSMGLISLFGPLALRMTR